MNTLKVHQGRLENLNDLTFYRNFTENILPLPESTINVAVRNAKYVPLAPRPPRPPVLRTPSGHRILCPKPGTALPNNNSPGKGPQSGFTMGTHTLEPIQGEHFPDLGLHASKDWLPFLLPKQDRTVDLEKLAAEVRRLEASCRRRTGGRGPLPAHNWVWPEAAPFSTIGISTSVPGASVWHIDDAPGGTDDEMQGVEMWTSEQYGPGETSTVASAPQAQADRGVHNHPLEGAQLQPDPLPSFDCFLRNTFEGVNPQQEPLPPGSVGFFNMSPEHETASAGGPIFPGPLKCREEFEPGCASSSTGGTKARNRARVYKGKQKCSSYR
ncbi:hypothetical protein A1O1_07910 [Capronia coronata CBS 617.96]|uniref:Uncharacterized protein n=1 Tax=Capronia coronata CBS 617.96 TaxID=1182541 RepID=W9XWY7_9EURO|nr:uncharacterized protein A1O1_07910 [Capronia coronata CBS 617.96]EXJ81845.1 hypothetical protein A1O1_07910 [Capronia coronata CBS 617.96]